MQVAQALEAMLFTQVMRPAVEKAGPAGEYALETFAGILVSKMEKPHG